MSPPLTLLDALREHAHCQLDAPALIGNGSTRSWAELEAGSGQVAQALRARGFGNGDRAGILAGNSPAWIEAFLGVLKAGGVAVPLNPRLAPAEHSRLLEDAGAGVLIAEPQLAADTGFAGQVVPVGEIVPLPAAAAATTIAPDDLAVVAYTSGTTGQPKGVMWSHRTLFASARGNPFSAELAAGKRILLVTPLGVGGSVVMFANALAVGATLVIAQFNPQTVLHLLAHDHIEFTGLVPTMIAMLVDAAPAGYRARSLRRIYYGAGTMRPQLFTRARQVFGCEFQQGYGMTETCIFGTRLDPADHSLFTPERLASAGVPMPGVEIKIVGDDGAEVAPNTPGEICIRSPGNMLGYWQREEETRQALSDGWYRTRDIGRCDRDGYLHLLDRKDDMLKSGGLNVSPGEVEGVLASHPDVEEAVVFGLPDERWGQRVTAVVRKSAGADVDETELLAFCRGQLAGFKIPRALFFTDTPLPRNALGKVLRQALRAQYATRPS
ncbi:MAG: AMP-binding protein [Deltaproteobacteria bacterium]|nr:AMP-binding protein [Deltaproteobacteria bacterium]